MENACGVGMLLLINGNIKTGKMKLFLFVLEFRSQPVLIVKA
jgi:hypothetical protein